MKNKYIFEFWNNGEVIDSKTSELPLLLPTIGQSIAIMSWENPNYSEKRNWWKVIDITQGVWTNEEKTILTQKIMIDLTPDPKNGLFKSDSEYDTFNYDNIE
ncbi:MULTISPECIES: hypothetical protein [unclassified Tenacibaculum]|uniref:hypothetical protein n=1 Tax=unclassified Tenacibaculum TaxID=2635139 RepID=UPI001F4293C3|nr:MULTISPECIES: hypothetical protein [unclassified Tenacibaculum]MCF2875446.1 hypothetical protein [Tenacibaculum sp. Cn5-1]MCF2935522.1 hypothetical protein [Tenacibaculum sp. Cn5-34]MCG7512082.1 hypothetical protein [Tenacibaculum sp. Cn5-46]